MADASDFRIFIKAHTGDQMLFAQLLGAGGTNDAAPDWGHL